MTRATHIQTENRHFVAVDELTVLIVRDGEGYFAQGVEIDYFAGGETVEDVKDRFARGFVATIREHLRRHRALTFFLKATHPDVLAQMRDGDGYRCDTRSLDDMPPDPSVPKQIKFQELCAA